MGVRKNGTVGKTGQSEHIVEIAHQMSVNILGGADKVLIAGVPLSKWNLETNHPVGSWWESDDPTDPGILFGGLWQRFEKTTLIGATDNGDYPAGCEGGEERVTLTAQQMPKHSHLLNSELHWSAESGSWASFRSGMESSIGYGALTTEEAGAGQSHNNMPPYHATYRWQRIG